MIWSVSKLFSGELSTAWVALSLEKCQDNYNFYTRYYFIPLSFNILNRPQAFPNHFNTEVLMVCVLKIIFNIRHTAAANRSGELLNMVVQHWFT
jgi:hypothetical protein